VVVKIFLWKLTYLLQTGVTSVKGQSEARNRKWKMKEEMNKQMNKLINEQTIKRTNKPAGKVKMESWNGKCAMGKVKVEVKVKGK
jgi:hypothetical protein